MIAIWVVKWTFCLPLYGHWGHWYLRSCPHSSLLWRVRPDLYLYSLSQTSHVNIPAWCDLKRDLLINLSGKNENEVFYSQFRCKQNIQIENSTPIQKVFPKIHKNQFIENNNEKNHINGRSKKKKPKWDLSVLHELQSTNLSFWINKNRHEIERNMHFDCASFSEIQSQKK